MYVDAKINVKIKDTYRKNEVDNVMFIKDNKVYIRFLQNKWFKIITLGIGCGSDIIDILLYISKCKDSTSSYTFVYFIEFFNRSPIDICNRVLLFCVNMCIRTDRNELQGLYFVIIVIINKDYVL